MNDEKDRFTISHHELLRHIVPPTLDRTKLFLERVRILLSSPNATFIGSVLKLLEALLPRDEPGEAQAFWNSNIFSHLRISDADYEHISCTALISFLSFLSLQSFHLTNISIHTNHEAPPSDESAEKLLTEMLVPLKPLFLTLYRKRFQTENVIDNIRCPCVCLALLRDPFVTWKFHEATLHFVRSLPICLTILSVLIDHDKNREISNSLRHILCTFAPHSTVSSMRREKMLLTDMSSEGLDDEIELFTNQTAFFVQPHEHTDGHPAPLPQIVIDRLTLGIPRREIVPPFKLHHPNFQHGSIVGESDNDTFDPQFPSTDLSLITTLRRAGLYFLSLSEFVEKGHSFDAETLNKAQTFLDIVRRNENYPWKSHDATLHFVRSLPICFTLTSALVDCERNSNVTDSLNDFGCIFSQRAPVSSSTNAPDPGAYFTPSNYVLESSSYSKKGTGSFASSTRRFNKPKSSNVGPGSAVTSSFATPIATYRSKSVSPVPGAYTPSILTDYPANKPTSLASGFLSLSTRTTSALKPQNPWVLLNNHSLPQRSSRKRNGSRDQKNETQDPGSYDPKPISTLSQTASSANPSSFFAPIRKERYFSSFATPKEQVPGPGSYDLPRAFPSHLLDHAELDPNDTVFDSPPRNAHDISPPSTHKAKLYGKNRTAITLRVYATGSLEGLSPRGENPEEVLEQVTWGDRRRKPGTIPAALLSRLQQKEMHPSSSFTSTTQRFQHGKKHPVQKDAVFDSQNSPIYSTRRRENTPPGPGSYSSAPIPARKSFKKANSGWV
ncbi:hypothetical protein BLNAU_16076 [Blattamonas nauphoetae]|uniref:Uncharacterized protein n=1 Tax=Blattamonas nauphoetae TaxID=2049346 RepID=A0ABQ9XFK0_9EUKA|nr:hypothetical protein BLNAU_16076 [Blattamonas nauphoetae]